MITCFKKCTFLGLFAFTLSGCLDPNGGQDLNQSTASAGDNATDTDVVPGTESTTNQPSTTTTATETTGQIVTTTASPTSTSGETSTTTITTNGSTTMDSTSEATSSGSTDGTATGDTTGDPEMPLHCTQHEECKNQLCDLASQECIDSEEIGELWVDNSAPYCTRGNEDEGIGTEAMPFCRITQALNQPHKVLMVHIHPGKYTENFPVIEGRKILLKGINPMIQTVLTGIGTSSLSVKNLAQVSFQNIAIEENGQPNSIGIHCEGSFLHFSNTRLRTHATGISSDACWITGQKLFANQLGTLAFNLKNSSTLDLKNSLITANGKDGESGGFLIGMASNLSLTYSTVLFNRNVDMNQVGANISCTPLHGLVKLRNSIIAGGTNSVAHCNTNNVEATNSVVDTFALQGGSNKLLISKGQAEMEFMEPNLGSGLYFPAKTTYMNTAVWQDGDPDEDFLGQNRTAKPGTSGYPGALLPLL